MAQRHAALGSHYSTIAPDLAGLGRSEAAPDALGLPEQAAHVVKLLDTLGIAKVSVVGHDVGGGVAQVLAASYPERVRALLLVDVVAFAEYWPVTIVAALQKPFLGEIMSLFPSSWLVRRQLERGLHEPERLSEPVLAAYGKPFEHVGGRFRFLRFVRALEPEPVEDAIARLATLEIPTLIIWGLRDPFQPLEEGTRLHLCLPGSQLIVLPDGRHFLPEDQPGRLSAELDAFLLGLPPSPETSSGRD